jgi:hypothetical protein
MGNRIRFDFTFGCNTGADVFKAGYPRMVLGVSCTTWNESPGIVVPLPPGSWSYQARRLEYNFRFEVSRVINNLALKGSCMLLQLAYKEDSNRVATARFQLV